jgi:hypothetical protein
MRMIFTFLSLITFSACACAQIASGVAVTESSSTQYKSPLTRNIDGGMSVSPSTSTHGRCLELSTSISQAIASPERKNVVVQGYGQDGKPRNELREYDKRATLEAEYRKLGC